MLRRLHNHIYACKLKEVFEGPLVLVYQTLGNVDQLSLKQQVQAGLSKEPTVKDATFSVCHMKNAVAAATGDDTLSKLFTNSNLLLGFKLPTQQQHSAALPQLEQQQEQQQQDAQYEGLLAAAMQRVKQDMSPQQVVGGHLQQQQPGPHIPQPALKAFVEAGMQLPSEQPLVLIGAFYKCAATPMGRLKKWIKLDQGQVRVTVGLSAVLMIPCCVLPPHARVCCSRHSRYVTYGLLQHSNPYVWLTVVWHTHAGALQPVAAPAGLSAGTGAVQGALWP